MRVFYRTNRLQPRARDLCATADVLVQQKGHYTKLLTSQWRHSCVLQIQYDRETVVTSTCKDTSARQRRRSKSGSLTLTSVTMSPNSQLSAINWNWRYCGRHAEKPRKFVLTEASTNRDDVLSIMSVLYALSSVCKCNVCFFVIVSFFML